MTNVEMMAGDRIFVVAASSLPIVSTSLDVTVSSVRHGSGPTLQIARPQSTEHFFGLLPGVVTRCVRFLFAHVCDRGNGRRLRHEYRRADLRHHAYVGDAPTRSVHLRIAGRPLWAAHPADDQHRLLLSYGIAHRVFSELHLAAHLPRALRNRYGRRMGTWGVAGNGDSPHCIARFVFRNLTARLCVWLPAGGRRVLDCVSLFRLARPFHSRSPTGISCALHPGAGA